MPFTVSHVAAILPLARTRLVPAALVIGTVVPDLFYFVPWDVSKALSHSPSGAVTVDLAFGALVFALWVLVFRGPVTDFTPLWLRRRLPEARPPRLSAARALLVTVSLLVGIGTHLAWDSLTHRGWITAAVPALGGSMGGQSITGMLQAAGSVLGLAALVLWSLGWLRRTPARARPQTRLDAVVRGGVWAIVLGVALVVGLRYWTALVRWGLPPTESWLVFFTVRITIGTAILLAMVASLAWWALPVRFAPAETHESRVDDAALGPRRRVCPRPSA